MLVITRGYVLGFQLSIFQWEHPLFLWSFSIAMLVITTGYIIPLIQPEGLIEAHITRGIKWWIFHSHVIIPLTYIGMDQYLLIPFSGGYSHP